MKTILLLLLSLLVSSFMSIQASVISVNPGTKTIFDAVAVAQTGDTLELSEGIYNETSNVTINKAIVFRNAENTTPVIRVNRFTVRANCTMQGITLDGYSEASEAIRIDEGANLVVNILNCNVQNFTGRAVSFHATDHNTAYVDTMRIRNCKFQHTTKALQATSAMEQFKYLEIKNCTFYKLDKDGAFINIAPGIDGLSTGLKVIVDHCTFYNCFSRRGVYLANIDSAEVTNNIAYYTEPADDTKSFSTYGSNSIVRNNIVFNVDLYGSAPREHIIKKDPLFVDGENQNLQLYANSPALQAGDNGTNLGDPNWGVSSQNAPANSPYVPYKKPYSMSPTKNSVRIVWQMRDNDSTGVVYYGKTPELGSSISSKSGWLVEEEGFVHVKEITGLEPFTTYYFQVGDENRKFGEIMTTKTAPNSNTAFRIAMAADFHDNSGQVWEHMATPIKQQNPDLFIHLGDIVNNGDTRPWNTSFFIPGEPLLSQTAMIGAIGNHETGDKPSNGPTTYYDYFSSFSHGYIDGTEATDPRGESYYAMDYGDVRFISINLNGDASSPSFALNSQQLNWLDQELENASSKWIFVLSHVSIYTTGYHGQWATDKKTTVAPVLEKHAAKGKHILFFSGNCHSFEHLYKSGVHYIKPSVAASNIRGQFNPADLPYSLIWRSLNGFSTIDVSEDGETVTMISRDETGKEFYSYVFTRTAQMLPSLYLTEPDGNNDTVTDVFRIKWSCFDETGNGKISLYHSLDSINGTLIADNLSTNLTEINHFDWNVRHLNPKGDYFIYGIIDDGVNLPVKKYAKGKVSVIADTTPPPAPTEFSGRLDNGHVVLNWQNPTRLLNVENKIDDFENGITRFTGIPHGSTATGSLEAAPGYNSNTSLKVNYNILVPWGQYTAALQYNNAQNFTTTPFLEFWYKGDGSNRNLRLIIKQDLDFNGIADDWWYNESVSLSSVDWQKAELDIRTFEALSWHVNVSNAMNPENIFAIEFIVPSSTTGSGSVHLDDIRLSGQIYPAPDYAGTKIVRRTDRFPTDHTDGEIIYNGIDETFTDENIVENKYYYAAFTYDDLYNYSTFTSNASYLYDILISSIFKPEYTDSSFKVYPNIIRSKASVSFDLTRNQYVSIDIFNSTGEKVANLINQHLPAGRHAVRFNTDSYNTGLHFVKLTSGKDSKTKKILIIK